jgi:hypothetical protein
MGIDTAKAKRQTAKATAKSETALVTLTVKPDDGIATDAEMVGVVGDNSAKALLIDMTIASNVYKQAFADIDNSDRLAGSADQRAAYAAMAYHSWAIAEGKWGQIASLAAMAESQEAAKTLRGICVEQWIGVDALDRIASKPKNDANRSITVDVRLQETKVINAHKGVILRGVELATHLAKAGVSIDAFNMETGVWTVPYIGLVPREVRGHVSDKMRHAMVPLNGNALGVVETTKEGGVVIHRFNASVAQFVAMSKPVKLKAVATPVAVVEKSDATDGKREGQLPGQGDSKLNPGNAINLAKLSVDAISNELHLDLPKAIECLADLWLTEDKSAPVAMSRNDLSDKHWTLLATIAATIQAVMNAPGFDKPVAASARKAG